jgi:hypothetical protein
VRGSSIRERWIRDGTVPCPSPEIPAEFIIGRRFAPTRWREFRPLPAKERGEVRKSVSLQLREMFVHMVA